MKRVLISIFLILICYLGFGQFTITQNLGSPSTLVKNPNYGGFQGGLIPYSFTDTSAASAALTYLKTYNGALIYTTSDSALYFRCCGANKWQQILPSGGTNGQHAWLVNGNTAFSSTIPPTIGTKGLSGIGTITNNTLRYTVPAVGIVNNNGAGVKVLGVDTSDATLPLVYTSGGSSASGWNLTGNAGTTAGTNFIGTTDNVGLMFKTNNVQSGYIDAITGSTSFGYQSLLNNTLTNTAFGNQALKANTTGNGNLALGSSALASNTIGNDNVAIGESAIPVNVNGAHNIGIGQQALNSNVDGSRNIGIGEDALSNNVSGTDNIGIGYESLINTTGSGNISIGAYSGAYNTTQSNRLYINSLVRGAILGDTTESIIYGAQDAIPDTQRLYLNSRIYAPYLSTGIPSGAKRVLIGSDNQFYAADTTSGGGVVPYVTPEEYGAVGNGSTDDATAIQSAVNSGFPVWFGQKNYRVASTISVPDSVQLIGSGAGSIISITVNDTILNLQGDNIQIQGMTLEGSSSGGAQTGIYIVGDVPLTLYRSNIKITNCIFKNFGYAGFRSYYVIGQYHEGGVQFSNCTAYGCAVGFFNDVRSEYSTYSNCVVYNCTIGWKNTGGNNNWTGGSVTDCTVGVDLESGTNDGHAQMVGAKINHNTTAVYVGSVANGYQFTACTFAVGDISIITATDIKFLGCEFLSIGTITVTNCTRTEIIDNRFSTNPTLTLTGTAPAFRNNTWIAGTPSYALLTGVVSPIFTDSKGTQSINATDFAWDNTNIRLGIGTNSPAGKLTIKAASNTDIIRGENASSNLIFEAFNAAGDGELYINNSSPATQVRLSAVSGTSNYFLNNVGIGSSTATTKLQVSGRFAANQGADVASVSGAIALGSDGNSFEITGTNAITLISNVNWVNGSEVTLLFTSTATLTDGTANSGTDIGMELAGSANFVASAGATLKLILSEIGGTQRWRETSRSVN